MKKQLTQNIKDKWPEMVAVLFGFIALVLSWQANDIARQQVVPHVVVLGVTTHEVGSGSGRAVCGHEILLANIGGARTAIVGWDASVSVGEREIRVGDQRAAARNKDGTLALPMVREAYPILLAKNPQYSSLDPGQGGVEALHIPYRDC
jgi:hypothetical protein